MDHATPLLVQYARYHRDPRNIATHYLGIPLIVFAVAVLMARLQTTVAGIQLSGDVVVWALATLWYLRLGLWSVTLTTSAAIALLVALAHPFGNVATTHWLAVGLGSFVVGWTLQFIGHFWEGRKPAFVDDIRGLLVGPMFVVAEIWCSLGGGQALREHIEAQAGPVARRVREGTGGA